ncbi:replication initiator protein A, partial [Clostridium perfringens]
MSKNAWKTQLRYTANNVTIEVNPGHRGVATIYDKEVLLYIASLMASRLEEGGAVGQDFQFTGHDLFRVTGTPVSAKAYNRLF